jgi:hypothetical protein
MAGLGTALEGLCCDSCVKCVAAVTAATRQLHRLYAHLHFWCMYWCLDVGIDEPGTEHSPRICEWKSIYFRHAEFHSSLFPTYADRQAASESFHASDYNATSFTDHCDC